MDIIEEQGGEREKGGKEKKTKTKTKTKKQKSPHRRYQTPSPFVWLFRY